MNENESSLRFRPEEYRGYLRMLAQTKVFRVVSGKLDASDLVQECLLNAYVHRDQFAGAEENEYRAWLRTILANVALEAARRYTSKTRATTLEQSIHAAIDESGRRLDELLVSPIDSPSQGISRNEALELALTALDSLPADQQEAIRLHHLEQMSIDETAKVMTRTPISVSGLVRRGLRRLRKTLAGLTE